MDISVICVGIKHSGNLGAIARICDNYDVKNLILVSPECNVDEQAYERATHGRRFLDNIIIVSSILEVRKFVDYLIALSARKGGADSLSRYSNNIIEVSGNLANVSGSIGIVLGRENYGLSTSEVNECDILCHIPLPGDNPVLNISHAASLVLWELIRNKSIDEEVNHRIMTEKEHTALFKLLEQLLNYSWLPNQRHYGSIRSFQALLSRALVTQREANSIIGTFRSILKSFEEGVPDWKDEDDLAKES
ncbi:MAG: hypothetical protein OEZ01_13230 [Candidatus Heimdallarchaeota archaeon]|nr:hypothetical protein [Candidatus Heimdallarchaeota archaeon]MDH5646970.1 hypothetical protein [Candidatus Heimdallarchaeota archaeon]